MGTRALLIVAASAGLIGALAFWNTRNAGDENGAVHLHAVSHAYAQGAEPDPIQIAKTLNAFPITPSKVLLGCSTAGGATTCSYKIEFQNNYDESWGDYTGPITFQDSVYPATTLTASTSSAGWSCTGGTTVNCTLAAATVPNSGSVSMNLSISFPASTSPAPDYNCVKMMVPASADSDCADVTNTGPAYDLDIAKNLVGIDGIADATVGKPVHFEVKVQKKAAVPANSTIVLVDEIPDGFTVTNLVFDSSFWSCTPTSGTGPFTITCTHQVTTAIPEPTSINPPVYLPTIEVHGHTNKTGFFVNCATPYVTGGADMTPDYGRHCADVYALPDKTQFNKQALDKDGNPITGPVSAGDTITYVLSYGAGTQGPLTITDTLSPNQTFVGWYGSGPPTPWTWSPMAPYSANKTTTYQHAGLTSPKFVMNVPMQGIGNSSKGGDGTFPITFPNRVYGIYHHKQFRTSDTGPCSWDISPLSCGGTKTHPQVPAGDAPGALIMCWNVTTLQPCPGAWPRSLDSPGDARTTPTIIHHSVVAGRWIYYPSARLEGAKTIPGVGCWDANTDAPCPFIPLPGGPAWSGSQSVYEGTTGVGTDPKKLELRAAGVVSHPSNPSRLYMYAVTTPDWPGVTGKVYCLDINASTGALNSSCWTSPNLAAANLNWPDIMVDQSSAPTGLFVHHGGTLTKLNLSTGAVIGSVPLGTSSGRWYTISPMPSSATVMGGVCAHPLAGSALKCFNSNLAPIASGLVPDANSLKAFPLSSTTRVLYPRGSNSSNTNYAPTCINFGSSLAATACTASDWNPNWPASPGLEDYGYADDPLNPRKCVLGLGDGGTLFRFSRQGLVGAAECTPSRYEETFKLDAFCAVKPRVATWNTITIANRPAQLTGGTITLKHGTSVVQTIPVGTSNSYTVGLSALDNAGEITVVFEPTYSSGALPTSNYQLELSYSADVDPQICYKTTVDACGDDVTNTAIFKAGAKETKTTVNLGRASGPECDDCLKLEPKVDLLASGKVRVTLSHTAPASFASPIIEARTDAPGVSIAPIGQPNGATTKWLLSGATPGQTIKLFADGVIPGGGGVGRGDVDKCCNGEVEIKIPDEPTKRDEKHDLKIDKTGSEMFDSHYKYELQVTNTGSEITQSGVVTVTDVFSVGTDYIVGAGGKDWACVTTKGTATSGATLDCTYTGAVPIAAGATLPPLGLVVENKTGSIQNCAVVAFALSSGLVDGNKSNNKDCVEIRGSNGPTKKRTVVDLKLDKTGWQQAGPHYWYELKVTNLGSKITQTGALTVSDTLPTGMGVVSITAPGWTCTTSGQTLTCNYTGPTPIATGAVLPPIKLFVLYPAGWTGVPENCAVVALTPSSGLVDINPVNNRGCVTIRGTQTTDLTIDKTAKSIIGPIPYTSEFGLTVKNTGTAAITAPATIAVTDVVPAGMTFTSAGGTNWNCGTGYPKSAGTTITCTYAGALPVAAGANLPPIKIIASAPGSNGRSIRNCAKVKLTSRTQSDANATNDNDCAETIALQEARDPDLAIEKTAKAVTGPVPNMSEFRLAVRNTGRAAITAPATISVTDVVPAGMKFMSASGTNWNCGTGYPKSAGATITCTYTGALPVAPGANLPPIKIVAAAPGAQGQSIRNCAKVRLTSRTQSETNTGNNEDCARVETKPKDADDAGVDLSIRKSAEPTVGPVPNMFEFRLTPRNAGSGPLTSPALVQVSDVVPAGMVFLGASGSNWNCGSGFPKTAGSTVTCTYVGAMPIGASASLPAIKVTAAVTGANQARLRNCASVTVSSRAQRDTRPGNNEDCATIDVDRQAPTATPDDASCRPPEHWNGRRCVRCREGELWDEENKRCRRQDAPAPPLACDQRTTNVTAGGCVCRYPNMLQLAPYACACPAGTNLTPGIGCIPECREPLTFNREKLACDCPKGTTLKGNRCERDGGGIRFNITPRIPGGPRPSTPAPDPAPAPARPRGGP